MATQILTSAYFYTHDNYTTTSTAATKTVQGAATPNGVGTKINYLLLSNTSGSNAASLSFDGGNTYLTLSANTSLELFPANLSSYLVKDASSGSHATLQCLYGTES